MLKRRLRTLAIAGALTLAGALQIAPTAATVQSSYDTIRIDNGGAAPLYQVPIEWSPLMLNLPDGGAWAFFTAQLRLPGEPGAEPIITNRQLFATHFDPGTGTWQPAQALPGEVSFGPTGVVDASGTVHLVYSIRGSLDDASYATLVYMTVDDSGTWSQPAVIVANENAGHQLTPDLTIDTDGGLHLAWQDQRAVSDELRTASASNADVFASDLNPDGTWSEPVQIDQRPDDVTNASRPQMVADGDRLVAVWSVYNSDSGLDSATTLMWSEREISDPNSWTEAQPIFDRGSDSIGGRFLDLADDPTGGATLVYGRRTEDGSNDIYLERLGQDSDSWSDPALIASGNRGAFLRIAVAGDGTTYMVYNLSTAASVEIGALAIAPEQTTTGAEQILSAGEEGTQAIPTVSVDTLGRPWVMYFHLPTQSQQSQQSVPTEARVLRSALISTQPAEPTSTEATPVAGGTPEAVATPAG